MTLPGPIVTERDAPSPRAAAINTGTLFISGPTAKGPIAGTLIESPKAFVDTFGDVVSYSEVPASVAHFFRQGGRRVYVGRRVGPAATTATLAIKDATTGTAITVSAAAPGDYYHGYRVGIVAGTATNIKVTVTDPAGSTVVSGDLADNAAAAAYINATYRELKATVGAGGKAAVVTAAPLAGGADDRAAITDATLPTDLDKLFPKELGPGQLVVPGVTTTAAHTAILTAAKARNRRAILDVADTNVLATLQAASAAIRALGELARYGLPVVGRHTVSAPVGTRTVPGSVVVAALIARSDAATGNPNLAAAGVNGIADATLAVSQEFPVDADRDALNEAGIAVFRKIGGQFRLYGFRSAAAKDAHPLHWQFSNVRLDMAVAAEAEAIAEDHVFANIDGQGIEASAYNGELAGMLSRYYRMGALYGVTPDDAYRVDTGDTVNTPETIADGRLRAVLSIRRSPFAERAEVEVVKVAVTDAV